MSRLFPILQESTARYARESCRRGRGAEREVSVPVKWAKYNHSWLDLYCQLTLVERVGRQSRGREPWLRLVSVEMTGDCQVGSEWLEGSCSVRENGIIDDHMPFVEFWKLQVPCILPTSVSSFTTCFLSDSFSCRRVLFLMAASFNLVSSVCTYCKVKIYNYNKIYTYNSIRAQRF